MSLRKLVEKIQRAFWSLFDKKAGSRYDDFGRHTGPSRTRHLERYERRVEKRITQTRLHLPRSDPLSPTPDLPPAA